MIKNINIRLGSRIRNAISKPKGAIEVRNPKGDWSPYFGQWEGQRKEWFDTNCCWAYAGNEVLEDQLEFLMKTGGLADYEIKWFKDNGYIDEDGDFYFSRRYIPIISGVERSGNDEAEFWRFTKIYGAIPNKMLPFTNIMEYFDEEKITDEMYALGREFAKRVNIKAKELGKRFKGYKLQELKNALQETELQIGIPVPQNGEWNQVKVPMPDHVWPDHSVALYKIDEVLDPEYPYFIYDQYDPKLKQLHKSYHIPMCTVATIRSGMLSPTLTVSVWEQFINALRQWGLIK